MAQKPKKAAPKKTGAKKTAGKKTAPKKAVKPAAKKAPLKKPAPQKTPAKTSAPSAAKAKKANATHGLIMQALAMEKAENIVSIDLAGKTSIADYMIVVSGSSSRAISSIAQKLKQKLAKEGIRARIEGAGTGDWVVVDALDVIVHLFRPEVRQFYNLEKLWEADFSTIDYTLYK
jgi:ribosome-associated protein